MSYLMMDALMTLELILDKKKVWLTAWTHRREQTKIKLTCFKEHTSKPGKAGIF